MDNLLANKEVKGSGESLDELDMSRKVIQMK